MKVFVVVTRELTNKLRYSYSCVLTDLPTIIYIKHNGDEKPEDFNTSTVFDSLKFILTWKT
jgi:hypothetical protein